MIDLENIIDFKDITASLNALKDAADELDRKMNEESNEIHVLQENINQRLKTIAQQRELQKQVRVKMQLLARAIFIQQANENNPLINSIEQTYGIAERLHPQQDFYEYVMQRR